MAASAASVRQGFNVELVPGSQYTNEDRRNAVATYMAHGSLTRTAELCSVPVSTLKDWMRSDWWDAVAVEIRPHVANEVRGKLQAAIHKGLDCALDRLDNGDVVLDKNGDQVRVPVKLRDVAITTGIMIDRLQASMAQPTISAVKERVDTLADQLAKLSGQVNAKTVSSQ
jgi:hypothetical protein